MQHKRESEAGGARVGRLLAAAGFSILGEWEMSGMRLGRSFRWLSMSLLAFSACERSQGAGEATSTSEMESSSESASSGTVETGQIELPQEVCLEVVRGAGQGPCFRRENAPVWTLRVVPIDGVPHLFTERYRNIKHGTYESIRVFPYVAGQVWTPSYEFAIPIDRPGFTFTLRPPRLVASENCCGPRDGVVWALTTEAAVSQPPVEINVSGIPHDEGLSADLDGDGLDEVILLEDLGKRLQVLATGNDGNLQSYEPQELGVQVSDHQPGVAADFDGDGFTDVAFSSFPAWAVAWGDGQGGFVEATQVENTLLTATAYDLDGDGGAELITAAASQLRIARFGGREATVYPEVIPEIPPFNLPGLHLRGGIFNGSRGLIALGHTWGFSEENKSSMDKRHLSWLANWQDGKFTDVATTTFETEACRDQLSGFALPPLVDLDADGQEDVVLPVVSGCEEEERTYLLLAEPSG